MQEYTDIRDSLTSTNRKFDIYYVCFQNKQAKA